VSHDQVPKCLSQAHVGVLPFPDEVKFRVSSPIKLFEYMAAGLPIMATRILCHTEVIGNDDYVFWAERSDDLGLYEALQQIWNKRERLREMSWPAIFAANDWSMLASAKKLKTAIEQGLALSL
jgi:glycosyltransferase involved in cell wall biosynthesis